MYIRTDIAQIFSLQLDLAAAFQSTTKLRFYELEIACRVAHRNIKKDAFLGFEVHETAKWIGSKRIVACHFSPIQPPSDPWIAIKI